MVSLQTSQPEWQQIRERSDTFPSIMFLMSAVVLSGRKKNFTFSKMISSTDFGNKRFSDIYAPEIHPIKIA